MSEKRVKILATIGLSALLVLTFALLPQLTKLKTVYDIEQFFPPEYDGWTTLEEMRKTFRIDNSSSLVVVAELPPSDRSWLVTEELKKLDELGQKIASLPEVAGITSLPQRELVNLNHNSIRIGKLIDQSQGLHLEKLVRDDALIESLLISKDFKSSIIGIELKDKSLDSQTLVIEKLQSLSNEQSKSINAKISLGGASVVQNSFRELLRWELDRFVFLSILSSILLIMLIFRGNLAWITVLTTLLLSNIVCIGTMAMLGWSFTVLSTTIPILIGIVVVSQTVYSFFRLSAELPKPEPSKGTAEHTTYHQSRVQSIWKVNRDILLPNFLGHFTTAIGFLTLIPSNIPLIGSYGLSVSVVILIAWLCTSISVLCFSLLPNSPQPRSWSAWTPNFESILGRWNTPILIFTALITLTATTGAFHLNWGAKLFDDLPKDHQARYSTEMLDREFGGLVPVDIEMSALSSDYWLNPENIEKLQNLLTTIREISGVGSALALPDFIKVLSDQSRLPTSSGQVSEILFLYSLNPKSPLQHFLSSDNLKTRVAVRLTDMPAQSSIQTFETILAIAKTEFPDLKIRASGLGTYIHQLNNSVAQELIFGFWLAMAGIALCLVFVFRSLRWALVACIPNLIPPAVLIGTMSLFQTPIKPALALVFAIAIGLAFNNTIYLLMRIQELFRDQRSPSEMKEVLRLEWSGCLFSTLVVLSGFFVFLFAQFSVNQLFGTFMILSTLVGVLADLVFFPCLIHRYPSLLFPKARS